MKNKFELNSREQKINYVFALDAECYAIEKEIARSKLHLILAKNAADRLVDEIILDDLVVFCLTGKYPDE